MSPYLICTGLKFDCGSSLILCCHFCLFVDWFLTNTKFTQIYTRELDTALLYQGFVFPATAYRDCWQEKNNLKWISKLVGHQNSWCTFSLILKVSGRLLENETQFSIIWRYYFIWCLDDSGGEIYVTNPSWISHRIKYLNAKKYVCILKGWAVWIMHVGKK